MSTFGKRLKQLRNEHNLTQDELAKAIKISKSSINMYERDEREPKFETLEAIADYFNVDMDYLLGRSDTPNLAKRTSDRVFTPNPVRRAELAVAIAHVDRHGPDQPIDLTDYPEENRDAIQRAQSFVALMYSLPREKREEVERYIQFIADEAKRREENESQPN